MMRQIYKGGGMNIIETAPTTRTLLSHARYDRYGGAGGNKRGFTIALPYVQYSQINNGLFVTFTNKPMESFDEVLSPQPFGQTFSYGLTCLQLERVAEDVHNLKTLINMYYGSAFQSNLMSVPALNSFKNLEEWEKVTAAKSPQDPNFILKQKWWMPPCKIKDMCTYGSFAHLTQEHMAMPFHGMSLEARLAHVKAGTIPPTKAVSLVNLQNYERILLKKLYQNDMDNFNLLLEGIYGYLLGTSQFDQQKAVLVAKHKSAAYKNVALKDFEPFAGMDDANEKEYLRAGQQRRDRQKRGNRY
jgi:hypothetical protein